MDILQFFILHHSRLYFESGGIYQRIDGLTDEQLKTCPYNMNSIVWLLWHIARCEDVGINRLITDGKQVLDDDNRMQDMRVFRRDLGTGMRPDEIAELSRGADIKSLKEYSRAVALRTQAVAMKMDQGELDEIPSPSYLKKVLYDENVLKENDSWIEDIYSNKTKGWFLGHLALTHGKGHLGQILNIRKLQGLGSGGR